VLRRTDYRTGQREEFENTAVQIDLLTENMENKRIEIKKENTKEKNQGPNDGRDPKKSADCRGKQ
jgi:hypothetical protein